jgi:hypothetical protein
MSFENLNVMFINNSKLSINNMIKINKDEYIKWYRIARNHINNPEIIPDLTDKEILR